MDKSPDAFRTISEVAEALETPAHVLRFWESRFPQIRPVKRAGGRRYYRPTDVALLSGIRHLLHDQGLTIRGVQKILREQGVRHVAALAGNLPMAEEEEEALLEASLRAARAQTAAPDAESAEILPLPQVGRPLSGTSENTGEVLRLYPAAPASKALETPTEDVPEAGHVWVEDEPELNLDGDGRAATPPAPTPLPRRVAAHHPMPQARQPRQTAAAPGMFDDIFPRDGTEGAPVKLSGLAARIRALRHPLSPEAVLELTDLHSRLGLLHAQVAEALRGRR